jgi:hypothetical protein
MMDYGPRGYLPERAARRARKLILREPLGMGWAVAAVGAGIVLAVVGLVFLLTRTGPPGSPFEAVGPIDAVDPRGLEVADAAGVPVIVVRAGGGVRAFAAPARHDATIVYCAESRRLESADGSVWDLAGRRRGGPGPDLRELPARIHQGTLYVDPTRRLPRPAVPDAGEQPACRP